MGIDVTPAEEVGSLPALQPPWPDLPLPLPQFRNPKVSLRVRLCDLLGHLQRSGEGHCQEFYRALYMHAQPLHCCLPSRHALGECLLPVRPWPQCLSAQPSPVTTLATHSFQRGDELRHADVSIVSLSP